MQLRGRISVIPGGQDSPGLIDVARSIPGCAEKSTANKCSASGGEEQRTKGVDVFGHDLNSNASASTRYSAPERALLQGRSVRALFLGPYGTGKTMAAVWQARRPGLELLRVELSRAVSKYIGETERISTALDPSPRFLRAILLNEDQALLGKRSEVKDAPDRYANVQVTYLLQSTESLEGLVIFTTNPLDRFVEKCNLLI